MQSEKIKETYYTAGEARKVLDLTDDRFQYWVKAGRIKKVQLPGRKHYLYPKKDVDKLAKRIEAAIITEEPEGLEYRKATLEDMEEEYRLSYLIFGKYAHSIEVRRAFIERNPDVDYHLYDHDELTAYIQIIPFSHAATQSFISGQTRGWELDTKEIEQFVSNKPLECIVMEMATTPMVPPGRRTLYGTQLLMGVAETFQEWGQRGVIINKLYGTSSTPSGIHIMRTAGFQVVAELGSGRLAFELDISTSNAKILRGYKEELTKWRDQKLTTEVK